eukprot:3664850-Rhodomonas_salina.1
MDQLGTSPEPGIMIQPEDSGSWLGLRVVVGRCVVQPPTVSEFRTIVYGGKTTSTMLISGSPGDIPGYRVPGYPGTSRGARTQALIVILIP